MPPLRGVVRAKIIHGMHLIQPVRTRPDLGFDPANCATRCPSCHTKKTRIECGHSAPIITPERQAWGKAVAELATNPNPAT